MKKINTLLIMMMITLQSAAQEIAGTVTDEKKEPVINGYVQIYQKNVLKAGVITDYDGKYVAKPLEPGTYDVYAFYVGFDTSVVTNVIVTAGQRTTINLTMKRSAVKALQEVTIYTKPLINSNSASHSITREDIYKVPTTNIQDVASLAPASYQNKYGNTSTNIGGARTEGTLYIIDGIQVPGSAEVGIAQGAIQSQFFNPSVPEYKKYPENEFMNVAANPLSTMSVDVDRASYANVRRFIDEGERPPVDAVRIEEMINYFNYEYPQPQGKGPISINTELTRCPWRKEHLLLRVGLQAKNVNTSDLPPSNLVFLIDVSGSMQDDDRLPLLLEGMKLLVKNLRPIDKVSIVTYAGAAG
jgi:Ca-activated chloride channel family protein